LRDPKNSGLSLLISAIYRRNGWTCSVIDSDMRIE
jgi:hypothetical protein